MLLESRDIDPTTGYLVNANNTNQVSAWHVRGGWRGWIGFFRSVFMFTVLIQHCFD